MYHHHALPDNWEHMEYRDFLEKRRELMAQVIQEGYQKLTAGAIVEDTTDVFDLSAVIDDGESEAIEFKSTLRMNLHTEQKNKSMEMAVLKTLTGFLNTNSGTLIVGVSDDGTPIGIEANKVPNEDKISLHLVNVVKKWMGPRAMTMMHVHFDDYEDSRVMVIRCQRSNIPVWVKDDGFERFYVRTGAGTTELSANQTQQYIKDRFKYRHCWGDSLSVVTQAGADLHYAFTETMDTYTVSEPLCKAMGQQTF